MALKIYKSHLNGVIMNEGLSLQNKKAKLTQMLESLKHDLENEQQSQVEKAAYVLKLEAEDPKSRKNQRLEESCYYLQD